MKKKFIILKKLCATITALCFTFTLVSDNLFASINAEPIQAQKQYFSSSDSVTLDSLFSSKYGKVVSFNNYSSDTVLINIQDLHCDYFVQKNISSLIEEISKKYKIDNVYVEGGIGKIDTSFLSNINPEYKQNLLDNLLKEGKLTGTEYYSATNDKTNLLKGVEDKDVYLKNIIRLDDIINSKKEISVYLSKINREIDFLKSKYLKEKNKKFDELLKQSENKNISQEKFVIELFNYAKKNNISLKNYENLQIYLSLFDSSVNNKKVQKELVKLLGDVKQTLSYDEYNKLITLTSKFTNIQVLSFFIKDFCKESNINLSKTYPNLAKFLALKEKSLECNPIELVKEERALIDVIRTYLSENKTELEITYLCDFEQFYKDYLSASLTLAQWEYVKLGLNKFKELYAKYSIENDVAKLEKYSKELNSFYDVNSDRNEIFVKNMKLDNRKVLNNINKNSSISDILSNAKRIVVLVAGGYHTDGINEILNKKGITNITITPNIANSTKDSRLQYEYLAQQQAMSVRQMIALGLISNATAKEQILAIVSSLLKNQNLDGVNINILVQQLNQIFSQDIKVSLIEEGSQLEFTFKDGTKQILSVDEEIANIVEDQNKTSMSSGQLVQVTGDNLKNIVSLVSATTFNQGTGIFAPQIYQISKTLCLFMVENKWYLGNGAVWEIANSEQKGQTLDGVEPVVYEYMPDFMQKALQSKQIGKNLVKKHKISRSILTKVLALILTVALMFGLTGCKSNVDYPRTLTPASITEIIEYQDESEQVMEMFNSDRGYLAYLPSYMTEEEISEWSSKDFYYVDGLVNTYDQAHAAIVYLKMGEPEKAREALLAVQNNNCKSYEIRRISGRKETLYRIYKSNRESGEILGEIVWVGLAAVQYKLVTGSDEFDTLIKSVDEYLLSRECVKGAGYYMGSGNMYFTNGGYSSAEHQVDIMAYFTLKSLLPDGYWKGIIPEHIVANVLPKGTELKDATSAQLDEMVEQVKTENSELLFNACKAFYKNMYRAQGVVRGVNDYYLVLDPNSWGLQVLLMIKEYDPKITVQENGVTVEKSIYEASELSKIDLNSLLENIETNFFVPDEELRAGLSDEDYQRFKGYHLYTWSREKFVDGKLNWSFEWSMQVATAYYLMGNYQQAEVILNDARRFASEMGLPEGMLPASNVNAILNYTDYGWKVPNAPSFAATITSILLEYGLMKADSTYASPFYPINIEPNTGIPSSILPSTLKKLNALISEGIYSLKKFLVEILNTETVKSLFNPLSFIKSHTHTTGAKILIAVTSTVFVMAFGILLSQAIPLVLSLIGSLSVALITNIGTHVIIDYRYLKSIGLSEAINLYGKENVRLTEKGLVVDDEEGIVPVYVINDRPANSNDFKFKSVPIKVRTQDGKLTKCWIGNYNGATIIFAEGVRYENIVREFGTTRQFESLYGGKTALKANVDIIEIDMIDADSNLRYSQTGNPIIGVNKLKKMETIDIEKEISLLRNKTVEAVTINQNIAIYIDDMPETISTSQDFIDTINLYVNSADLGVNAKILFTDEYINRVLELLEIEYGSKESAQKEFIRILEQLKRENKEISVILKQSDINNINNYKEYGIFSYIVDKGSYGCEYIDTISDIKVKANFITNLNQVRADGNLAIIKVSDFKKEISKTSGLFTFLNSSLNLKEILQKRNIEFIKQTANNFDFNQIPNIDIELIAKIISSSENKFEQLSKYLNGSDSISMYYLGLSNDEQRNAFMEEILKRALVVNYLRNFEQDNAYYGLQDKNLENILAKALVEKYKLKGNFEINSNASLNETTAAEVEFELLKKISQLSQQAFEQNDPQSIDDIIKLIPLYAERKVELRTANINVVDIQNIKGILSAA